MAEPRPHVGTTSLTLIDRARANEADAWARLVMLYTPLVRHWCFAGGLQPNDIDDVVQEVCRAAFSGLDEFHRDSPGDTFRGWLRTITRTALALHFPAMAAGPGGQRRQRGVRRLQEVADPACRSPDDDLLRRDSRAHRRALELVRAEFEDRTWQMFWLTAVEDRQPADVADRSGLRPWPSVRPSPASCIGSGRDR